ncbi:MAG: Metallo-peptidase family Reprolysin-like [Caulobacteraceae bacterium]|nr:Metallo-peptidase family Reprolysin-like [Caulobacteraceae bacterium]
MTGADGVDSLVGIESLGFADQTIANSSSGALGAAGGDPALQFSTGQILVYFLHAGETAGGGSALRDWTPSEKAAALSAGAAYSAVANVNFTETTDRSAAGLLLELTDVIGGNITTTFQSATTLAAAGASAVSRFATISDPYWTDAGSLSPGGGGFQFLLLREFGHALGLTDATYQGVGNLHLTVTSVGGHASNATLAQGYAATPMALDIPPLQARYGAAVSNPGDSVYDLAAATNKFITVYDTGGVDTLLTTSLTPATLDLHANAFDPASGTFPTLSTPFNYLLGGYYFAPGSVIENATGGGGGDVIIGNDTANMLRGNAGTDTIVGRGGDDVIYGGADNDVLDGDDGNDMIHGDAGDDRIEGLAGVDTAVYAGARSAYTVTSNGGTIFVSGPEGTDTLTTTEFLQFADQTFHFRPGTGSTVNFAAAPSTYAAALRDFDGNDLGGGSSWVLAGHVDIQGDGDQEYILFNQQIGRWATIGPAADGKVYFDDHSWAGDTRVVGIYIDPEVQLGHAALGGPNDSQRRFQNDLNIGNIKGILGAGDYNHDGLQEVYFSLTDGTAYLHAYMHADGNIQYANYQDQAQVTAYLTANGFDHTTWDGWF